jgi:hypothetical protein
MHWAQRLKRVFNVDVTTCDQCGGKVKVIACIESPKAIEKILKHVGLYEAARPKNRSPPADHISIVKRQLSWPVVPYHLIRGLPIPCEKSVLAAPQALKR